MTAARKVRGWDEGDPNVTFAISFSASCRALFTRCVTLSSRLGIFLRTRRGSAPIQPPPFGDHFWGAVDFHPPKDLALCSPPKWGTPPPSRAHSFPGINLKKSLVQAVRQLHGGLDEEARVEDLRQELRQHAFSHALLQEPPQGPLARRLKQHPPPQNAPFPTTGGTRSTATTLWAGHETGRERCALPGCRTTGLQTGVPPSSSKGALPMTPLGAMVMSSRCCCKNLGREGWGGEGTDLRPGSV